MNLFLPFVALTRLFGISFAQDDKYYVDDGCHSESNNVQDDVIGFYQSGSLLAGVRCCSDDGSTCDTPGRCGVTESTDEIGEMTFDAADNQCKNYGRLCTKDELLSDICCGTGGNCDSFKVWTSTSACDPNPCNNGGTCADADADGTPECTCEEGFSGDTCDTSACDPNPCNNGGTCADADADGTAECTCEEGFSGDTCDTQAACEPNPCKNGGTCRDADADDTAECICAGDFSGDTCDIPAVCNPNPCNNGGTCGVFFFDGSAECTCAEGFTGYRCHIPAACDPNPCNYIISSGTCADADADGTAECTCDYGFSGDTCETYACDPNPCNNGGTCAVADADGTAECTCEDGFSGDTCNTPAGIDISCSTWPTSENYGCTGDGGSWESLDRSMDTSRTSDCEKLCIRQGTYGCCFLGNGVGCFWKGGAEAASYDASGWLSVNCRSTDN